MSKGGVPQRPGDAHGAKNTVYTQASPSPKALRSLLERLAGTQDLLGPVNRCGPGHQPSSLLRSTTSPKPVTWMIPAPSTVPHLRACPFLCSPGHTLPSPSRLQCRLRPLTSLFWGAANLDQENPIFTLQVHQSQDYRLRSEKHSSRRSSTIVSEPNVAEQCWEWVHVTIHVCMYGIYIHTHM